MANKIEKLHTKTTTYDFLDLENVVVWKSCSYFSACSIKCFYHYVMQSRNSSSGQHKVVTFVYLFRDEMHFYMQAFGRESV